MASLVLDRSVIFPSAQLPPSGVGSLTIHTLRGTVVLHHTIDARRPDSFILSDDRVSQIITGMLSDQSFRGKERVSISDSSELEGTYRMEFADHDPVVGEVLVYVRQRGITLAPKSCGSCVQVSGCGCGNAQTTHSTVAKVKVSAPRESLQPLPTPIRPEPECPPERLIL